MNLLHSEEVIALTVKTLVIDLRKSISFQEHLMPIPCLTFPEPQQEKTKNSGKTCTDLISKDLESNV